jgi:hypothetical protein
MHLGPSLVALREGKKTNGEKKKEEEKKTIVRSE